MSMTARPLTIDYFKDRSVVTVDGCWEWKLYRGKDGYGRVKRGGKTWEAHRLLFVSLHGELPKEVDVHHRCTNRACVNPDHLEKVGEELHYLLDPGMMSNKNAAKTQCEHGHPFDEANTYIAPSGWRQCKICRRATDKKRRKPHGRKR